MAPLPRELDRNASESKPQPKLKWILTAVSVAMTTSLVVALHDQL